MTPAVVAAIGGVVIAMITVAGQWVSSRNDRALTLQELELLSKLDASSEAARDLSWVIDRRIAGWRTRYAPARIVARRVRWVSWYLMGVTGVAAFASGGAALYTIVFALALIFGVTLLIRVRLALNRELKVEAERGKRRDERAAGHPAEDSMPSSDPDSAG